MQIADNPKPLSNEIRQKMERYREQLLDAGMVEPTRWKSSSWHWLFYKLTTSLTAFIVNLHGSDSCIEIVYGYASTAFTRMTGDENALIEHGVSDKYITIREKIIIYDEADEEFAKSKIQKMYDAYLLTEKEELLNHAKIKRKEFIQQIASKLKPLGFKKQGNIWTRALESIYFVVFNAQKSAFSDEYYFNVYIGKNDNTNYGDCYYTRVAPSGMCPMDWQVMSKEEFEYLLESTVVPALEQIIHTPLHELGKLPSIQSSCSCNRKICEQCWVEKKL